MTLFSLKGVQTLKTEKLVGVMLGHKKHFG